MNMDRSWVECNKIEQVIIMDERATLVITGTGIANIQAEVLLNKGASFTTV